MTKLKLLVTIGLFFLVTPVNADEIKQIQTTETTENLSNCHPNINTSEPQYIIGYGSLIQTESKKRTAPESGNNFPIIVEGFERGWFVQGATYSPTTFLGVIRNSKAQINGVIYQEPLTSELLATDQRERAYCRTLVLPQQITMLDQSDVPSGQIWIYTIQSSQISLPNSQYPIVQSYVDIFISGCLEIEKTFAIDSFAHSCVTTTTGWSKHWVNDRIYPRRPFIYQPEAKAIDHVLQETIPKFLLLRKIE